MCPFRTFYYFIWLFIGTVIGLVAGAAVGWGIVEFGDVIIDWVVGWFD